MSRPPTESAAEVRLYLAAVPEVAKALPPSIERLLDNAEEAPEQEVA